MNALTHILARSGLLTKDLDYHLLRAAMVLIFLAFGYQKWFAYEAQILIPYISNGPLIFWMYPVFGLRGASWFLGVSEWTFGVLLFLGFWNKPLGIVGAIGSTLTFLGTVTIIPFAPNGWESSRRRFSRDVRQCSFSHQGRRASCRVVLFAEAGCRQVDSFNRTHRRRELPNRDSREGPGPFQSS
jgi:uncharacterized membrane protein YkgB